MSYNRIEPSFESLITSVYSAVLYNLGEIKLRGIETTEENLEMAKFNIGLLEVLRDKTAGNLSKEEDALITNLISTAKMRFVEHTKEVKES